MSLGSKFYESLLERAAQEISRDAGNCVVVLVPPGSSRHALARRLGSAQIYTYSPEKLPGSKPIEELLQRIRRAPEELRIGLTVAIPRDTTSALMLHEELRKAGVPVKLVFLPHLYFRILKKDRRRRPPKYARLNYRGVGLGGGVSLTLLRRGIGAGDVKGAVEAFRRLAPREPDVTKRLREGGDSSATASLIATALALLDPRLDFIEAVPLIADEAWRRGLGRFLEDAVSIAKQTGGRELLFAALSLLEGAEEAARYIDREELEGVADEVATKLGLGVEELRSFVKSLAALARGGMAAADRIKELKKRLDGDFEGELEKLREAIRRRIEELDGRLDEVEKILEARGALSRAVRAGEGGMAGLGSAPYLAELADGEGYPLVKGERFERYAATVEGLLLYRRLAVVRGARGVGKSVLVSYVAARLLGSEGATGARVRRVYILRHLDAKAASDFLHLAVADPLARLSVLILYDPPLPVRFGEAPGPVERSMLEDISTTLRELVGLVEAGFPVLASVPSDLWSALDPDLRSKLKGATVDAELCDGGLLKEMLKVYSRGKIPEGKLEELAGKILKFEEGCAVAASLVGKAAAERGGVEEAERLVEEAQGSVLALIVQYLGTLFEVRAAPRADALAEIIALRKPFIRDLRPGDPVMPPGLVKLVAKTQLSEREIGFFTVRHHDLIEEALALILEPQRASDSVKRALKLWSHSGRLGFRSEAEAVSYVFNKHGHALSEAFSRHDGCWPRLALLLGHALAGAPLVLSHNAALEDDKGSADSALKPCDIDSYFLVGNKVAPFSTRLVLDLVKQGQLHRLLEPAARKHFRELVKEAERLVKEWKERGVTRAQAFYALGLVAAVSAVEGHVDQNAARVMLHIAFPALQQFLSADAAGAVLALLRPLGLKAPELYASKLAKVLMEGPPSAVMGMVYSELMHVYREMLYQQRETWLLALAVLALTKVIADVVERRADVQALLCLIRIPLLERCENAELLVRAYSLFTALVTGLPTCDGADAAVRAKELLDRLEKFNYERALYSSAFEKFLLSRGWGRSEEAARMEIGGARARLVFGLAFRNFWSGQYSEAERLFRESAKAFESLGDRVGYLAAHDYALRSLILSAGSLNELREAARGFEELWDTARRMPPAVLARPAAHSVLCHYLVYLATAGARDSLDELLRRHRQLLLSESRGILCALMLRALGADVEKPEEFLEAARPQVLEGLLEYLERRLEPKKEKPNELSLAFGVDKEISYLIGIGAEDYQIAGAAGRLNHSYKAQQLVPSISKILIALILHALSRGDHASVKLYAQRAVRTLGTRWPSGLFKELYESCCEGEKFKLALLKLYYALL